MTQRMITAACNDLYDAFPESSVLRLTRAPSTVERQSSTIASSCLLHIVPTRIKSKNIRRDHTIYLNTIIHTFYGSKISQIEYFVHWE